MTNRPSGQTGTPQESSEDPTAAGAGQDAAAGAGQEAAPADMQAFIGRQLRAVYDDVAKQPVPDRFIELMRQLESKQVQR